MNRLLRHVLVSLVRQGILRVTGPNGMIDSFGDGAGAPAHIHIKTLRAERAITFDPMLALPEAYMRGEVDIAEGGVLGLMRIVFQNIGDAGIDTAWTRALDRVRHAFRRFQQINTTRRARRNVAVHYDLSVDLYRLFLDDDMQYSCAYFQKPEMTLDQAQSAKKRHIATKLQLEPDLKVLDIGCGWGGLGLYFAKSFKADVLGVTLSREQHADATDRARSEGLASRVRSAGADRLYQRLSRGAGRTDRDQVPDDWATMHGATVSRTKNRVATPKCARRSGRSHQGDRLLDHLRGGSLFEQGKTDAACRLAKLKA